MGTWKICIDTGGTFTDCIATDPDGKHHTLKILSSGRLKGSIIGQLADNQIQINTNWKQQKDIFTGYNIHITELNQTYKVSGFNTNEAIITLDRPLENNLLKSYPFELYSGEEVPIVAARLLTKTPLALNLPEIDMRLGSTKGTNALLEKKGSSVVFLVTKGFKDLLKIGDQRRPHLFSLNIQKPKPLYTQVIEIDERISANGDILQSLDTSSIEDKLPEDNTISFAITLINSYKNPIHEQKLSEVLTNKGYKHVSASSQIATDNKVLTRAETTVVNAYLLPLISSYIDGIRTHLIKGVFRVMTSSGSLTEAGNFHPKDSLLSGPAGGIIGAMAIAEKSGIETIVTFDMGGTSTDVSIQSSGISYESITQVGDASIVSPSIAIDTIAAGGGSICSLNDGVLMVGPESAGSLPGPACYNSGGPLTITDLNLLSGRLVPDAFNIPINVDRSREALESIEKQLEGNKSNPDLLIESFLQIANEKMAEAIKKLAVKKGHDLQKHSLVTYGGAGAQHACAIADLIGIQNIIIPYHAGLLSAYGIDNADVEKIEDQLILKPLSSLQNLDSEWAELENRVLRKLVEEGCKAEEVFIKKKLCYLRFKGQNDSFEIDATNNHNILKSFKEAYTALYGHWLDNQVVEVESLRLISAVKSKPQKAVSSESKNYMPQPYTSQLSLLNGRWEETPVYSWESLNSGAQIKGRAIVISSNTTVFVDDNWQLNIDANNNALLSISQTKHISFTASEEGQIELFKNRFAGVVEEMGAMLQRTSFSVNVKDRMDFSCGLIDSEGYLVINAPHIPVHLGSLGICVRKVASTLSMESGDVIITNHPAYGGSHLPDITLIAPVYIDEQLISYVANRAHHSEIGGKSPGSMPVDATSLEEEGIIIQPQYLVKGGIAQWESIKQLFRSGKYPSRSVDENIADLRGALASINTGIKNMEQLCSQFGQSEIIYRLTQLRQYVSQNLNQNLQSWKGKYSATEQLDDGHRITVNIKIADDIITFDFSGTSSIHPNNLNANDAIVNSAVIYILRLLLDKDLPLNEGLMNNVKLILPTSLLNPDFSLEKQPAVVGGNTEVSQRLVDTLLKALGLSACSQGTMNNLLFGDDTFGYYETICGGTGAGNGFDGHDAVHQHMTNTKITDPELLEARYPVRLNRFEIRENSGGNGQWKGGNGIVRDITFLKKLRLTLLTQHRLVAPYGLNGGHNGKCGIQMLILKDGSEKPLDGITQIDVSARDRLIMKTPGGGGYGSEL